MFKIETPLGNFEPNPEIMFKVNEKLKNNLGAGFPALGGRAVKIIGASIVAGGVTWYMTRP